MWAIPIDFNVIRLGPLSYNKTRFHNRNSWVGKSTAAAIASNARILTNLESIGVKDVYRNTDSQSNITTVFLVFDTEDNYHYSVSRSISMDDINLEITPHTQFSEYGMANRRLNNSTSNPQTHDQSDNMLVATRLSGPAPFTPAV